jgi:hypothetical protein
MIFRIFAVGGDPGLTKYINLIRLEYGAKAAWSVEICDAMTWIPPAGAAGRGDIHLYLDIPVRIAVPWATYNVFACTDLSGNSAWAWAAKEMDLVLARSAFGARDSALKAFRSIFKAAMKGQHPPALPPPKDKGVPPPKVGIITVTRNRPHWWTNMVQNVLKQEWPISRLEWIIVDDGDADKRLTSEIAEFQERAPGWVVRHVVLDQRTSVGEKRNVGVRAASADVSVFVMMDDDDHYPAGSVATRVAWLSRANTQIVYCSMLPMYDVTRYISAMNVPPMDVGPSERVSEATLAFTRDAWAAQGFADYWMAEGESFLMGREGVSVEIPPTGVIVSFIHSANSSSRRVPADQEPNGCHYGFSDEFFRYLHENAA